MPNIFCQQTLFVWLSEFQGNSKVQRKEVTLANGELTEDHSLIIQKNSNIYFRQNHEETSMGDNKCKKRT